jgi:hypothetical protein
LTNKEKIFYRFWILKGLVFLKNSSIKNSLLGNNEDDGKAVRYGKIPPATHRDLVSPNNHVERRWETPQTVPG